MAWWRGGGAVPIGRDEEEGPLGASGRDGGKDGVEGEEEAEGLLAGEGAEGRAGGRERRGGRQGRLQVKHDGTERFCRKVRLRFPILSLSVDAGRKLTDVFFLFPFLLPPSFSPSPFNLLLSI